MRCRGTVALVAAALLPALALAPGTAAAAACPGEGDTGASAAAQEKAMLCLVNRAREGRGLDAMSAPPSLARAADRKSGDILRCDEFSHEACWREFTFWLDRVGYRGCREGENIAYASGTYATPRTIFRLWMNSAGHRRNILGPYREIGIGLRVGTLGDVDGTHVWTQEFGSRDC
ncbi:MAG TPA: CAP domain-containing protein [Solirubrobacterales bacterium]